MTHVPTTSRGRFIGSAAAASAVAFGSPAILSAQNKEIVVGLDVLLRCGNADSRREAPTEPGESSWRKEVRTHHFGLPATASPAGGEAGVSDEGVPVAHDTAHRAHDGLRL